MKVLCSMTFAVILLAVSSAAVGTDKAALAAKV